MEASVLNSINLPESSPIEYRTDCNVAPFVVNSRFLNLMSPNRCGGSCQAMNAHNVAEGGDVTKRRERCGGSARMVVASSTLLILNTRKQCFGKQGVGGPSEQLDTVTLKRRAK